MILNQPISLQASSVGAEDMKLNLGKAMDMFRMESEHMLL